MKEIYLLELFGIDRLFIKNLAVIYEMGPYAFNVYIISIVFFWLFFFVFFRNIIINKLNYFFLIEKIYKKHLYYIIPLIVFSFAISFIYANEYGKNFIYFYLGHYSVIIYNPFVIVFHQLQIFDDLLSQHELVLLLLVLQIHPKFFVSNLGFYGLPTN